jgi:hypothetical protein
MRDCDQPTDAEVSDAIAAAFGERFRPVVPPTPEPLTLRDRAALAALTGLGTLLAPGEGFNHPHDARAKWAWAQADAFMAARGDGK